MKPRVIFPYTEAGLGHIMPMNSIADEFEKLYGDKVEIVRSQFFSETGNKKLIAYEKKLKDSVKSYNRNPALGFLATLNMDFWGTKIVSACSISLIGEGATKFGIEHMRELKPDLVVSTHWATNYYAMKMDDRPLTAMYCPDAKINTLFRYPCDLAFVSTKTGYARGVSLHKRRYNKDNLKLVPFLIRKEAFEITESKAELREKLGLEDRFTVLLAEGGYGVGKIKEVLKRLLARDLPINIIAVCGKNEKLYEQIKQYKAKGNTRFLPFGLVDNMLELIAASDLSVGKSGASLMAEPCYFGVPQLITHYANDIERWIGNYYIKTVGSAIKQFDPKKAADLIEEFYADPSLLQPYVLAAKAQRENYGAEKCARYIFGLLCTRFPELKDGTEIY
ncbi:MAG: glycosyltransferase [Clostridia bacterium]|nr:glycosyltransferase [Clostridia bacterium]